MYHVVLFIHNSILKGLMDLGVPKVIIMMMIETFEISLLMNFLLDSSQRLFLV